MSSLPETPRETQKNAAQFAWQTDDVFGRIASRYDLLCDVFSVARRRLHGCLLREIVVGYRRDTHCPQAMSFADSIRPYVDAELRAAREDATREFAHLERAHVLGQASTREHVRVHWRMLSWAVKHRDAREFFGQVIRLTGAATKTFIGLVPTGNTGGANVSAIRPMPIDPELARIIERARDPG